MEHTRRGICSQRRESPRIIVAAHKLRLENEAREREARMTPREKLERAEARAGIVHSGVEPLSDREVELYADKLIRRPSDYEQRLAEYYRQKDIVRKSEVAGLIKRVVDAKEAWEARLYSVQRYVCAVREHQAAEEKRIYGF